MLNYVWITLLFLGIITALATDIVNQNNNKYRNNEPLPVAISFNKAFDPAIEKSYDAILTINKKDLIC